MAGLASLFIKMEVLEEIYTTMKEKQKNDPTIKGFKATISIGDDTNEHGQNVAVYAEQNKQQIADKIPRYYVGNGGVFWTNGKIEKAASKNSKLADAYQPAAYQPPATTGQPAAAVAQPAAASQPAANNTVANDDLPF